MFFFRPNGISLHSKMLQEMSWYKLYPLLSSCASRNFKTRMHWSRFAGIPLPVIYVATPGLRNQVGFDAIPVWFIGHIYFENELVLPNITASSLIFEFMELNKPSFVR
jgi:hypothetical protein